MPAEADKAKQQRLLREKVGSRVIGSVMSLAACPPMNTAAAYRPSMSLPPDQPPSPAQPELTPEERRARQADRLITIRLRRLIVRELEGRGITTPAEIGAVLGMPAAEATKLLRGHQWREGDVALLQAAATWLGVQAPAP
jgi:hypothetical protein